MEVKSYTHSLFKDTIGNIKIPNSRLVIVEFIMKMPPFDVGLYKAVYIPARLLFLVITPDGEFSKIGTNKVLIKEVLH
jgi:hypothetical protein